MEKIIDITDRVPAMRQKRRRRTNIKFLLLLVLFVALILLLLYFQSSYSDIKKIEVKGDELLNDQEYLQVVNLKEGQSLWDFKKSDVVKKLGNLDWVKEASVERKWPNRVEITVSEWKKVAYLSKSGDFYPMLENGYVFQEMDKISVIDAPVFINFDEENLRKKILKQLVQLKPEVSELISQISATPTESDPYAIKLYMNDGYEVHAEISSLAEKLNYYPSIVAQIESQKNYEKGIIDIEVGSYYRPYSEEYEINLEDSEEEEVVDHESSAE